MTDHQHNDNLEQFFRQNLEGYSPEPPGDFWARMEPSIPAKPPFWRGWLAAAGRWMVLGLLVGAIVVAGVLWRNDRQQVEVLTELVQEQQREIERIREKQGAGQDPTSRENLSQSGNFKSGEGAWDSGRSRTKAADGGSVFNKKQDGFEKNTFEKNEQDPALETGNQFFTKNNSAPAAPLRSMETGFDTDQPEGADSAIGAAETDITQERSPLATPETLNFLHPKNLSFSKHAPSVKKQAFKHFEPYPRFSFEAGAAAFVMPVRRLFESDTVVFETGGARPSLQGGLLVNFEMSGIWMLQTGFQFKNVRSENLSLRYNSFPLNVRRRWAWGRRNRLELKTGLVLNTLINGKTQPENQSLPGLESSFLCWVGGAGVAVPLSESLTILTETNLGYTLTPMANEKRTMEVGLYFGLRYRIN